MDRAALKDRIVNSFDSLPAQLGTAARYVLDNPDDVALLSMREQARRAGVQPWTMTRLAKRMGCGGYDTVREIHAEALRQGALGFAGKAGAQVARQKQGGDQALAAEIVQAVAQQVEALADPATLDAMAAAAGAMAEAERVFCLGLRSSQAVAAQFAYVMSFLGDKAVLLDQAPGRGLETISRAGAGDVLFATTVAPYTRATVDAVRFAGERDVPVVALTDSPVSPIATIARHTILVTTDSPSFFHSMAPAFVVGEVLAALIAGRGGEAALEAIERTERQLSAYGVHILPPPARRPA